MFNRVTASVERMTEWQKVTAGIAGLACGAVLVGALAFAGVTSLPLQVAVSLLAVATMVAGTLLLGTSDQGGQTV